MVPTTGTLPTINRTMYRPLETPRVFLSSRLDSLIFVMTVPRSVVTKCQEEIPLHELNKHCLGSPSSQVSVVQFRIRQATLLTSQAF